MFLPYLTSQRINVLRVTQFGSKWCHTWSHYQFLQLLRQGCFIDVHSISTSVCVCVCVRAHEYVYETTSECVCAAVPTSKLGGRLHTPMHARSQTHTYTHTLALALLSPWVVCAANVYDLNQANPTGLFQWIENDLQDAATGPRREEEIRGNLRAPFQVTLWLDLHTCLYVCSHAYLHLFLSQCCGILCLCLFHLAPTHRSDGCLYLTN